MEQKAFYVKMVLAAWESQHQKVSKLIGSLSDEDLRAETAPGRNSGAYLVGHLASVSDGMLPLLDLGQKQYPELEEVFVKNPDKSGLKTPSLAELRNYWNLIHADLDQRISRIQPADWFGRHTAVSAAEFEKEPHRNKLNIIISRTNHMSYHFGQLVYLSKK